MADNREEISELVEKRGIYRRVGSLLISHRSAMIRHRRTADVVAAMRRLPRNRCETRGAHRRSCTSPMNERRAWPEHADGSSARKSCSRESEEHARIVIHGRLEGYRETRDVSITSRHPSATAVIVVVRSPLPSSSLIRRAETCQHAFDSARSRESTARIHEYCRARSRNCGTDYSLRSRSDGLATCVIAMTVPTATAFKRLPLSVSVRPFFLLVSRSRYRPSRLVSSL